MKNSRSRSLPHPLLTPLGDDIMPNVFEFSCPPGSIGLAGDNWRISGRIHHQCSTLQEYVDGGFARFGVHVECPRTFYRAWFSQTSSEIKLELPSKGVRGRVEMLAFCVATRNLEDYQIAGQHRDYGRRTFKVRSGDFLAIAQQVEFDAFLDIDPIRKISSILDIQKAKYRRNGPAHIDFDDHRIQIELGQEEYERYIELRADLTVRGLLVNGVVFPAILQAINYLHQLSPEELSEAKSERRWCRSLVARLEKNGVDVGANPEKVYLAAQKILKEPVNLGLNDLLSLWRDK